MSLTGVYTIYSLTDRERWKMPSYNHLFLYEFIWVAISTHLWREINGPTKLICDPKFYDFIKENNLRWFWDDIDSDLLKSLPSDINYKLFWTYPKMFAQFKQKERFAMVDADLYTYLKLDEFNQDVIYGHEEVDDLNSTYPKFYSHPNVSHLFEELNKDLKHNAINTSLIVYNNLEILEKLEGITNQFIRLIPTSIDHISKDWIYTIYCEQKVLGNIVKDFNYSHHVLQPIAYDCNKKDYDYYPLGEVGINHLWGMKKMLRDDEHKRIHFTKQVVEFLESEYGELYKKLLPYFDKFMK